MNKFFWTLLVGCVLSVEVLATTYYVKVDGDDSKDGKSWENAWKTPKLSGLGGDGNEVVVSNGVYNLTTMMNYGHSRTTLRGFSGNAAEVVFDGGGVTRLIGGNGTSSNVVVNLTLRNGYQNQHAGGGLIRLESYGGGMTGIIGHTYSNVVFSGGTHTAVGGGAYLAGGCRFYDCVFTNCTSGGNGGAVYLGAEDPTEFHRCRFWDNSVTGNNGGGAVYCLWPGSVFKDCVFNGNIASWNGGAVYAGGTGKDTIFAHCAFSNNVLRANTSASGGAICSAASNSDAYGPRLTDCDFYGNVITNANGGGGTLYGKFPLVSGCTFRKNRAVTQTAGKGAYGAVWYYSALNDVNPTSRFENCTMEANVADGKGGVFYAVYSQSLFISNCVIRANTAGRHGSVFAWENYPPTTLEIRDCLIEENKFTVSNVTDEGYCTILTGDSSKGGIDNVVLDHTVFRKNESLTSAMVAFLGPSSFVNRCTFERNRMRETSQSIQNSRGAALTLLGAGHVIRNCLFLENANCATQDADIAKGNCGGGGVFLRCQQNGNDTVIENCDFIGNTSRHIYVGDAIGAWHTSARDEPVVYRNNLFFANTNLVTGMPSTFPADSNVKIAKRCFNCVIDRDPYQLDPSAYGNDKFKWWTWSNTGSMANNGCRQVTSAVELCLNDMAKEDFTPTRSSPLFNRGLNQDWMTAGAVDLSGQPRLFKKTVDIGCYELNYPLNGMMLLLQ